MKVVGIAILALIAIVALSFGLSFTGFAEYSFFAPRYAALDNKVFHESQAYNDGMIRDLEELRMQYIAGTPEQKAALKGTVLHRFEVYPRDRMPPELRDFYESLNR